MRQSEAEEGLTWIFIEEQAPMHAREDVVRKQLIHHWTTYCQLIMGFSVGAQKVITMDPHVTAREFNYSGAIEEKLS